MLYKCNRSADLQSRIILSMTSNSANVKQNAQMRPSDLANATFSGDKVDRNHGWTGRLRPIGQG